MRQLIIAVIVAALLSSVTYYYLAYFFGPSLKDVGFSDILGMNSGVYSIVAAVLVFIVTLVVISLILKKMLQDNPEETIPSEPRAPGGNFSISLR